MRRWAPRVAGAALLLLAAQSLLPADAASPPPPAVTPMQNHDLWALIDTLPRLLPFSKQKIESTFGVALAQTGGNEYFIFYGGGPAALAGGVAIEAIDLRIRREQPHPGFLVLKLSGTCVPKKTVFERYPKLVLTEYPRGRSMNEEASYTHSAPWGELSFGFAEHTRDCLRTLVLDPKPD